MTDLSRHSRHVIIETFVYTAFAALAARSFVIFFFPKSPEVLSHIADSQYSTQITLAPYRGAILDRKGDPLAISLRMPSLAVNPRIFRPSTEQVAQLRRLLDIKRADIRRIQEKRSYFSWLRRRVPHVTAQQVEQLRIPGVYVIGEPSRFYPAGSSAAHLVGFVGMDDQGLTGLERQFEKELRGTPGKISPMRDARGRSVFARADEVSPERPGQSVVLTIDKAIQDFTEEALIEGVRKARAKRGFAVVADPHTGRLLAVANYPDFDPNDSANFASDNTINHAFADLYEPGSVMKTFIIAEAIERGLTSASEMHNCEGGSYAAGGVKFGDSHAHDALSTTDVIAKSSNICAYKIADRLGKRLVFETLRRFGFATHEAAPPFPIAVSGRIAPWQEWLPIRFANIAFGQGMVVSAMEILQAYGAIANGGTLVKPLLVERIESAEGKVLEAYTPQQLRRVLTPKTAEIIKEILGETVRTGSGSLAATASYTTAGKTGTSEKVDPLTRTYSTHKRIASFVGFAPVRDPHLVIYVVVDEPGEKPYYGGTWAAPVFSKIAQNTLGYLNVLPDLPQQPKS